jgi:hypothetical protein
VGPTQLYEAHPVEVVWLPLRDASGIGAASSNQLFHKLDQDEVFPRDEDPCLRIARLERVPTELTDLLHPPSTSVCPE